MSVKQLKLLSEICGTLGITISSLQNDHTGLVMIGLQARLELRMSEIGIYSFTELGRRLGWELPGKIAARVKELDAQATKDYLKFQEP